MNEYFVLAQGVIHGLTHALFAWRVNSGIQDEHSQERIAIFIVGPRSLAKLWRLLFGLSFVRSRDRWLVGAGIIHLATTVSLMVGIFILVVGKQ